MRYYEDNNHFGWHYCHCECGKSLFLEKNSIFSINNNNLSQEIDLNADVAGICDGSADSIKKLLRWGEMQISNRAAEMLSDESERDSTATTYSRVKFRELVETQGAAATKSILQIVAPQSPDACQTVQSNVTKEIEKFNCEMECKYANVMFSVKGCPTKITTCAEYDMRISTMCPDFAIDALGAPDRIEYRINEMVKEEKRLLDNNFAMPPGEAGLEGFSDVDLKNIIEAKQKLESELDALPAQLLKIATAYKTDKNKDNFMTQCSAAEATIVADKNTLFANRDKAIYNRLLSFSDNPLSAKDLKDIKPEMVLDKFAQRDVLTQRFDETNVPDFLNQRSMDDAFCSDRTFIVKRGYDDLAMVDMRSNIDKMLMTKMFIKMSTDHFNRYVIKNMPDSLKTQKDTTIKAHKIRAMATFYNAVAKEFITYKLLNINLPKYASTLFLFRLNPSMVVCRSLFKELFEPLFAFSKAIMLDVQMTAFSLGYAYPLYMPHETAARGFNDLKFLEARDLRAESLTVLYRIADHNDQLPFDQINVESVSELIFQNFERTKGITNSGTHEQLNKFFYGEITPLAYTVRTNANK